MIAGSHKGDDFAGLVRYLFHGKQGKQELRGHLLGGTVLAGNPDQVLAHFESLKRLRPDVVNPVHHIHVSLAPGEELTILQWSELFAELGKLLNLPHYALVGHADCAHSHVHMIGTRLSELRVRPEVFRDQTVIMRCLRKFELKFGLRRVESPNRPRNKHGRVPQAERRPNRERRMAREGKKSRKQILRDTIDEVIEAGYKQGGVLIEMKKRGYEPMTTMRDGHPVGICWQEIAGDGTTDTPRRYTGASLGTEYSGKRFFQRIGGLYGETDKHHIFDPSRIRPFDFDLHWASILRNLGKGDRAVASPLVRY